MQLFMPSTIPLKQPRILLWTVAGTACFIIAVGLSMLTAWRLHIPWLQMHYPWLFYMQHNTALLFTLCGIGLIGAMRRWRRGVLMIGIGILAFAGITLAQYITGQNFGIDQLLLKDYIHPEHEYPGRMAPNTAIMFLCAGSFFLFSIKPSYSTWHVAVAELLSFTIFALGAAAISGQLLGSDFAYSWGSYTRMSVPSALSSMALGSGMMAINWNKQEIKVARIPLWLPALLCFLVLLFDMSTPLGLAAGIAYIPLIFCSLWFTRPHTPFIFAAITTFLTVFGYFASPPGPFVPEITITNRLLTIGSLWTVATLIYLRVCSEHRLRESEERSRNMANTLGVFTRALAHDLKEPVRTIHSFTEIISSQEPILEKSSHYFRHILHASKRMQMLIEMVFHYVQLETVEELAHEPCNMNQILSEVEGNISKLVHEYNTKVMNDPLPEVFANRTHMLQLWQNLLANAVRHSSGNVTVHVSKEQEIWLFSVHDNGHGIAPKDQEKIFLPFKRLSDPKEEHAGLGLTICKKIVELYGGSIWCESQPEHGATFFFTLPKAEGALS